MHLQTFLIVIPLMFVMFCSFKISASQVVFNNNILHRKSSFCKFSNIFPLILFSIIVGMRYDVGVDHLTYLQDYYNPIATSITEPGFIFIRDTFRALGLHFVFYFTLIAFIQIFFYFYSLKDYIYILPILVFFIFTTSEIWSWMNMIRQAISCCIWIYSINYIVSKNFFKYFLCCILALLFHKTAVILVPIYFIANSNFIQKSIKYQLCILFISTIIGQYFWNLFPYLTSYIEHYAEITNLSNVNSYGVDSLIDQKQRSEGGESLAKIAKLIIDIIIVLNSHRIFNFYKGGKISILYFFFYLSIVLYLILPKNSFIFERPFSYFYSLKPIFYSFFLYYLLHNKHGLNKLMAIIMICLFTGIFILHIITVDEKQSYLFQFFFQQ